MTIRGGGVPDTTMASMPSNRMGPPPRSFAADAHDCIMVRIQMDLPNTSLRRETSRAMAGSPRFVLDRLLRQQRGLAARHGVGAPDLAEVGAVLAPVNIAARRLRRWPSANVDRRCARRSLVFRPGRRNGSQPNQETVAAEIAAWGEPGLEGVRVGKITLTPKAPYRSCHQPPAAVLGRSRYALCGQSGAGAASVPRRA